MSLFIFFPLYFWTPQIAEYYRFKLTFKILFLGKTGLIAAAEYGNLDVVKLLLEHGATINAKNKWGKFYNSMMILSMHP